MTFFRFKLLVASEIPERRLGTEIKNELELGVELDEELDENINAPLPESDDPAPFDSQAVKESGSKKKTAKARETARKTTH